MGKREEKAQTVAEIKDKLSRAQSAVLADYRGLNVAESTDLRQRLRAHGVEFRVAKNTLILRAASEIGLQDLKAFLEGPTAIAFGYEDPVIPAKVLMAFSREARKMEIKGGLVEGKVLGPSEMKRIADLPSREVLLGKVVTCAKTPMYRLATALSAPLRNFVYAAKALKELRESQA